MDEKKVNQTLANASNAANNIANKVAGVGTDTYANGAQVTATPMSSTVTQTASTQTASQPVYNLSDPQRIQSIHDMYDAQIASQRAALQESGDQAVSDAQANRDQIAKNYQTQMNAAATTWERQRRNFLEGANQNGINTGAGSQAQLAMMGQNQRTQGDLGRAQAQAETEADRNIADIRRNTQAAINEAVAKNDYQRAAALLDEYNQIYTRAMQKAQALAQYGDFSGFASVYGDEAADNMRLTWLTQNPDLAYQMGQITQAQWQNLKAGQPMNQGLDASGQPVAPMRGIYDDPWAYGGSGWNSGGGNGQNDQGAGSTIPEELKVGGSDGTGDPYLAYAAAASAAGGVIPAPDAVTGAGGYTGILDGPQRPASSYTTVVPGDFKPVGMPGITAGAGSGTQYMTSPAGDIYKAQPGQTLVAQPGYFNWSRK